jgi:hypothetical protein
MCAEFGRKLSILRCLIVADVSKANGCLRSSEITCLEINWWPVGTAKFRVLTSMTASPQL